MKGCFRVGEFEVEPQLNSVQKGSTVQRLEPKVMQVLVTLTVHAGEVITKERLIQTVWPDTFVGDDVLIRCISEIRRVFEDDARSPRVVQTIPKVGYRFIAAVEPQPASPDPENTNPQLIAPPSMPSPQIESKRAGIARWLLPGMVAVFLALVALDLWILYVHRTPETPFKKFRTVPFTSYPGSERQPAFSPDGNRIAFAWNGPNNSDSWSIYIKLIGSDTPVRLTMASAEDLSPTWSPDGKWIAFIRHSESGNAVYMVPAIGGPEQKLYTMQGTIDWDEPGTSWSPDGKFLIFPDGKSQENPSAIYRLAVDSYQVKPLTQPPNTWDGDYSPVYSPDGSKIAFVRGADVASRNVYVMDADGTSVHELTSGGREIFGITWMRDSKSVVYSSDIAGTVSLWRVSVTAGTPERLPFGNDKAFTPVISTQGDRLAYSQNFSTWNLMRIDLKDARKEPEKLATSTERDSAATFSPDGKRIAFESWRSGTQEIWVAQADGLGAIQLTEFNGPLTGSPSWSPDGKKIAFDSRTSGRAHIYAMNADGGVPEQITDGDFNDIIPNWSRSGEWIYFGSKRSGSWQLWKVSTKSRELKQVTINGGFVGRESLDGEWVYFTRYDKPGLWRIPANGGAETQVAHGPPVNFWGYWSLSKDGIYFLAKDGSNMSLRFMNVATGVISTVHTFAHMPARYSGLSMSSEHHVGLYSDYSPIGSNIIMIEIQR